MVNIFTSRFLNSNATDYSIGLKAPNHGDGSYFYFMPIGVTAGIFSGVTKSNFNLLRCEASWNYTCSCQPGTTKVVYLS